jgi:hypothetical protein
MSMSGDELVRLAVVGGVFIVAIAALYYLFNPPSRQPATISVSIDIPPLVPGETTRLVASVTNSGGDAEGIELALSSVALASTSSSRFDLGSGGSYDVDITVRADDVRNGWYAATLSWSYSDSKGSQRGGPIETQIYVLPLLRFTDYGWETTGLLGLLSKDTIGTSDQTTYHFRIQSRGAAIYSGLSCQVNCTIEAPGLNISPTSISIERLGPQGTSEEKNFTITTTDALSGTYTITIYLYSDQFLVEKHSAQLTVKPEK